MRKLVENFVHKPDAHCESSALRDVSKFYGFKKKEILSSLKASA